MIWNLAALLIPLSLAAVPDRPPPAPIEPPAEEGRVVVDPDSGREDPPPPPASPGLKRNGMGRLVSVDIKERRVVLDHGDGVEQGYSVPESARLTFAPDERPLRLDQLRRGDSVGYEVVGPKVARLHLEMYPPRGRPRRPPPPPDEDYFEMEPEVGPDIPMYQSEPKGP